MPLNSRSSAARELPAVREGRNGWLYPADALDEFSSDDNTGPGSQLHAAVLDTLPARRDFCAALGAQYLCLPVPDRTLSLRDCWPASMPESARSRAIGPLTTLTRAGKALPMLIDLRACFEKNRERYPAFSKASRLWTPEGCLMAYQRLCWRLGHAPLDDLMGYSRTARVATLDLAAGYPGHAAETMRQRSFARRAWRHYASAAARTLGSDGSGADAGLVACPADARAAFANDHPEAIDQCVLVFGDAFAGSDDQWLTGMLAETFATVRFVGLGAGFDAGLVERLRPDVVINCHAEFALREFSNVRLDQGVSGIRTDQRPSPAVDRSENPAAAASGSRDGSTVQGRSGQRATSSKVTRERLLDVETYDLPEPTTVQPAAAALLIDRTMVTRPVDYVEVTDAEVLFTGGRWRVATRDGVEIVRRHVDDRLLAQRPWRRRRSLPGTSMLLGTSAGAHCYYHWMLELLPKLGLLQRRGLSLQEIDHFLVRRIAGEWQLETLARFGVDRSRIVETERRPRLRCERVIHVDHEGDVNRRMNRFVPLWLQHEFGRPAADSERLKLFIVRPESVGRTLGNAAAVLELLEPAGYTPVLMEGMSVREQAALFARADVVVAAHGGALTNMIFCRPGTAIVELFSRHVYPYYQGLAACCGHRYHAILEAPATDYGRLVSLETAQRFGATAIQRQSARQAFDVPLDALLKMLALLEGGDIGVNAMASRVAMPKERFSRQAL